MDAALEESQSHDYYEYTETTLTVLLDSQPIPYIGHDAHEASSRKISGCATRSVRIQDDLFQMRELDKKLINLRPVKSCFEC